MFHKKQYLIPQSPLLKNGKVDLDALQTPDILKVVRVSSARKEETKELMTVLEVDCEATPCSDKTKMYGTNSPETKGQKRRLEKVPCEVLYEKVSKLRPQKKLDEKGFTAIPR